MIFHLFAPITCYLALPFIIAIGVTFGLHKEEINIITIYFIELQVYVILVVLQIIKRRIN
jgi:hypothetical protein